MDRQIEIAVNNKMSKTDKGKLLENLGCEILSSMQYVVAKEVRITGIEVDLMAKHKVTGEEIFVECKAHKNTLPADTISKLLGNVLLKDVSAGWLITSGPLGKDAKGIMKEWENKPNEERKKLAIYNSDRIIDLLISARRIISDKSLILLEGKSYRNDAILLISNYGLYWLKLITINNSSTVCGVTCYNAKNGEIVDDENLINSLKKLDTQYRDYQWLEPNKIVNELEESIIEKEIKSIVKVSGGDEWGDYRPSRPQDFVGRSQLIESMFEFLDKVRKERTDTRLLAITAPSGWGKSSYILRICDYSKKSKNKEKYYIYAVDVRAALSNRYAEFAIMECFSEAIKEGFIKAPTKKLTFSNLLEPFENDSFKEVFEQLKDEEKVILICFDQFEETFSKKELMLLFENIKRISINIDSIKENIVLGFAWKTDVIIPAEHPAYHMWHSLSDRRKNFELTIFSNKEMKEAIKIFSKQLNQKVNKFLREYLIDQCQGYPWLLKKLCIHVYKLVTSGINQEQIIGQNMNIEDLFQKDLSELSHKEDSCIRKIANDTPADYYRIHDIFGEMIIQELINKRLVLRKGQKLILYWDIFMDYVLDGKVPKIIFYYVPQLNFNKYIEILDYLEKHKVSTIDEFSKSLNITEKTALNNVKDLIMFGNIKRNGNDIQFMQNKKNEAIKKSISFWRNHILFNIIETYTESKQKIAIEILKKDFNNIHAFSHISFKTKDTYFKKALSWLRGLYMLEVNDDLVELIEEKNFEECSKIKRLKRNFNARNLEFMGQGTYNKVLKLVNIIRNDNLNEEKQKKYRNEISLLKSLNLIYVNSNNMYITVDYNKFENELKKAVKETKAIKAINSYVKNKDEKLTPEIVGEILKKEFNKDKWKKSTIYRNGGAVLRWYKKTY